MALPLEPTGAPRRRPSGALRPADEEARESGVHPRPADEEARESGVHPRVEPSDGVLVRRALAGDTAAMEALYRRYVRMVAALGHRMSTSPHDVDDLVQDAFVAAFERLSQLRDPEAFGSWLGTISRCVAKNRLRRERLRRRLGLAQGEGVDAERYPSSSVPPDVGADVLALDSILDELEPEVRKALLLRRVEGLTVPEVAREMGVSPATVKRRVGAGEVLLGARLGRRAGGRSSRATILPPPMAGEGAKDAERAA